MKNEKNLYEILTIGAKSGKEAYSIVNEYIECYIGKQLKEKVGNHKANALLDDIVEKVFNTFDDFGNLTQDKAFSLVSNIIANEI